MDPKAIIPEEIIDQDKEVDETPPAIFGSWKRIYWLVVITLATLILLFHVLTTSVS